MNEPEEVYIPPEKKQQVINNLRLFYTPDKNKIPKDYKVIRQET